MRRNLWLFCLAIALTGCADDRSDPSEDLRLTAVITPAVFRVGERVDVTITLSNHGERTWKFFAKPCPMVFEVLTDAAVLPAGTQVCTADHWLPWPLLPGQTHVFTYRWAGDANGAPLLPGSYQIRGRVGVENYGLFRSDPIFIQVTQ